MQLPVQIVADETTHLALVFHVEGLGDIVFELGSLAVEAQVEVDSVELPSRLVLKPLELSFQKQEFLEETAPYVALLEVPLNGSIATELNMECKGHGRTCWVRPASACSA